MTTNSIRLRVLAVAIASIVATLAVAGVSLVFLFERQVLQYVEHDLNVRWKELASAFDLSAEGDPELSHRLADPRYEKPYGGAYWQVSEVGGVVLRSRSLWDKELPLHPRQNDGGAENSFEVDGPNGSRLYVIEREVTIDGGSQGRVFHLAVALDHGQVVERRQAFGWDVTRVLGPIALVLVLFAWLQISLGLRPLWTVGEQLNRVQTGRIRRMPRRFPEEIAPLVDSINKLLDRQENLVRKARDRAGALAHGLKTPLTILTAEVRRLEERGLRDEAKRMQEQLGSIRNHVDREVARARTSGASVGGGAYTAVDETVARLVKLMQHMPRGDTLVWHTQIPSDLRVNMDPHDFGEVLGNLLDNARKWAETRVTTRVVAEDERACITVEDDGPGFPESGDGARPERGMSRNPDPTSSGLGLGIVEDILAEYGSTAVMDGNRGCSVTFRIPLCRDSPSAGRASAADDERAASPTKSLSHPPGLA
jgi:signal transduction histidine kinase